MGIFSKSELEKLIKNINESSNINLNYDDIKSYLNITNDEEIICNTITLINEYIKTGSTTMYETKIKTAIEEIYPLIVHNNKDKDAYYQLLKIWLQYPFIVKTDNLNKLYYLFNNKEVILNVYNYLASLNIEKVPSLERVDNTIDDRFQALIDYLIKARQYYVDDTALISSFISLIYTVGIDEITYGELKKVEKKVNSKLKEDKKANGIYDIDQSKLQEIDRKIETLGLLAEKLETIINIAEEKYKTLNLTVEDIDTEIARIRVEEIKTLRDEANNIISNFRTTYLELLGQEKQSIIAQKDEILALLENDIEKKRLSLLSIGDTVTQRISIELSRIKNESNSSIKQIQDFIASDENVKRLLAEAKTDDEFVSRLQQIELLSKESSVASITPVSGSVLQGLTIPSIIIPEEQPVDSKVNYYFDTRVPYKDRFSQLMERKHQLEEQGEIFHEKFDDVLAMVLQNDAPYMYGPSGCGKTYMIEQQLTNLLGTELVISGYIMFEQDILGYTNAGTGAYVASNLYRCWKHGKKIFFDELDNGQANATTVLNSFITSKVGSSFVFPNGENVKRHPNFRIIAAGNTKGAGKTVAHNTRQKLDESVMQRLTPIEINYDNRIEEIILKDYPGWYEFATAFRSAVAACGSTDEINTIGTFTTRDAETIKKYKDDGAFDDEQLMDYQIVENKDQDYLNQIKKKLQSSDIQSEEGKKLLKIFNNHVDRGNKQR